MKTFEGYRLKNLDLRNRIVMPPMCMYSADEGGYVTDWHYAHYLSRAVGGVGLIIVEATGVTPNGRITSNDLGIWNDDQVEGLKKLTKDCKESGAYMAIQLAHAGRKSTAEGEIPVAPSSYEFSDRYIVPKELSKGEINEIILSFKEAARRANEAGFDAIEIHGAHGYLIHEFLSPLSNRRKDEYGGSLENRVRLLKDILKAVKEIWPSDKAILLRVSADDYKKGGINIDEIVSIVNRIKDYVDMVHVSSGGLESAEIEVYPGYQLSYSETIKRKCRVPTIAVGLISEPDQVEEILGNERADLVALGRELLRNPSWVLNTAHHKSVEFKYPEQYERAFK